MPLSTQHNKSINKLFWKKQYKTGECSYSFMKKKLNYLYRWEMVEFDPGIIFDPSADLYPRGFTVG